MKTCRKIFYDFTKLAASSLILVPYYCFLLIPQLHQCSFIFVSFRRKNT